jgi:hypothetical protein
MKIPQMCLAAICYTPLDRFMQSAKNNYIFKKASFLNKDAMETLGRLHGMGALQRAI